MKGLVLEGGGMRGMFTNGVIDVLMENGIEFDAMIGVSAGVLFGCNYKSKQPGRALRYNLRFKDNWEYMSWRSLLKTGDFVGNDFSFRRLPYELDKFDFETYRQNPMKMYCVCTDIENACPVYKEITDCEGEGLQWLRASSSMPVFAQPVKLGGMTLLDGGITDSIPLQFMLDKGYEKNIVVLTQPVDYRKKPTKLHLLLRLLVKKYPKVAEMMKVRHQMYNSELDLIAKEQKAGRALLIYPEKALGIGRLERDEVKIKSIYEQGRKVATLMLPQIKEYFNSKL